MPLSGEYVPSPEAWVREQVEAYERSGGREANLLAGTPWPIIVVTTRGKRSGNVRKFALMRVEHDGEYGLVASKGGAAEHPVWYHNLVAHPDEVMIQDGPEPFDAEVRLVRGEERARWWQRAVAAYPPYAEYQQKTDREIPVFVARRKGGASPRGEGRMSIPASHRDLLQAPVATLATVGADGRPQLSEVWFLAEGDTIRISLNTARQKTKNLQANPKATVFILDLSNPARYLEVRGDVEIAPDDDYAFATKVGEKYAADLRAHDRPGESRVVVTLQATRLNAVDMGA